jgi:toxin ParE1/3/4
MPYKLKFAPAFKASLRRLMSFLERKHSVPVAASARAQIKQKVLLLAEQPELGPICDRLLDLGVPGYRQLLIGEHNMLIYKVDHDQKVVSVLLVFDTRQSLQKLLTDLQLVL